jgi:hypothetical protein
LSDFKRFNDAELAEAPDTDLLSKKEGLSLAVTKY